MSKVRSHTAGGVTSIASVGFFSGIVRFFRDRDASLAGKLFVALVAAYVVWPADFVPDVLPVVGWLDDLGAATLAFAYLARVSAKYRAPALIPPRSTP